MKRLICLLLALMMLPALTFAEKETPTEPESADWFYPVLIAEKSRMHLLTDAQLKGIADLTSEEIGALVESLFLAAAGVKENEEIRLWKSFKTVQQKEERSAENAAYRIHTLPWLLEAFAPGNRPVNTPEDTSMLPRPMWTKSAESAEAEETPWTPEETIAAFEENAYGKAYLEQIAPLGGRDAESCLGVTQAVLQVWLNEIDHERLLKINDDFECWLYAAMTPIDYPVVQCRNNSYYLDRLFNGEKNPAGTIFMDYRNLTDFRDPNTLVYGHHMRDSSMFHSLTDYETEGFFDAHPYMVIVDADEIYVVEVFSAYVTDSRDHCYEIALSDEDDMRDFVQQALKKSDFNAHVTFDYLNDNMVTMSTCTYHFESARYVAIGRLDLCWRRPLEDAEPLE